MSSSVHAANQLLNIYCLLCSISFAVSLGHDFKLEGSVSDSAEYSGRVATLPISVNIEILADLIPGEVESFELKITNPLLTDASSGQPLEVLVGNSVTVVIVDDDGKCCKFTPFLFSFSFLVWHFQCLKFNSWVLSSPLMNQIKQKT